MAEYYTKVEADALFADANHTHNIEDLGGTELEASRVALGAEVSADFDDAYTVDEGFASVKDQLDGKAPINHTHAGYAAAGHEHTGYAETDHTHDEYAPVSHGHTDLADANHTHTPADIGAAPATHAHDYASPTHSHAQSEITGLEAALDAKAPNSALTAKADLVGGKVPASQLPGYVDDVLEYAAVANFPATGESGKIYLATGTNKSYRWSGSTYVEVAGGVALGETSATAYRGDRGKTAYDHSQNGDVHVTAAQKTSWDSKAAGNHTHTPASIGAAAAVHTHDYAASSHGHSYNDLSDKPTIPTIPSSLPANGGNADTVDGKHASDFATSDHTHVAYGSNGASTYKKVWIATTGSDDNIGTADAPMATITGAIRKYSAQYKMLDISLADGTYTENLGSISADLVNLAIRSNSENKDNVTINMTTALEVNIPIVRLYNVTFNVTVTGIRPVVVTGGILYAYNVRFCVPEGSSSSCVNVYNGCSSMLMHCILNAGTSGNSAGVYGNQAGTIKAINCTSERTVAIGFYAHNGTDIVYTDTITATTAKKETYYGKCTVRS